MFPFKISNSVWNTNRKSHDILVILSGNKAYLRAFIYRCSAHNGKMLR
jgi:hypothetical protein